MANQPKISVCIPTYNGARYILEAIDSVLKQTFQDFEIIIVDNASTDHSAALLARLATNSDKIHVYRNEENLGLAGNLNKCVELAHGQCIKYLCVDDVLLPDCLALMIEGLDAHPEASLICGGRISIDAYAQPFGLQRYAEKDEVVVGNKAVSRCLYTRNHIGEPTAVMFRKSNIGSGFREDLPQLMDMEMWFRMLETGALLSIKRPVCLIRFHEEQMTKVNIKSGALIEDNVSLFREYSKKPFLQVTPWLVIQHKLLMTYRVWGSRKFISRTRRLDILSEFGIPLAYALMPVISAMLAVKRKIFRSLRRH